MLVPKFHYYAAIAPPANSHCICLEHLRHVLLPVLRKVSAVQSSLDIHFNGLVSPLNDIPISNHHDLGYHHFDLPLLLD